MASSTGAEQELSPSKVFISYYKGDNSYAQKLYSDLSAANLDPWIDSKSILSGQSVSEEIEKAIESSRYFVALLSTRSVNEIGNAQVQIKKGLHLRDKFPESQIFFIPARLDNIEIPFELRDIQAVDMFPNWEDGLKTMLKSMNIDHKQAVLIVEHQRTISLFNSYDPSSGALQIQQFKGQKQFFVGRQNYINKILKDELTILGSKVSIVGPGGSGKSQLAFNAINKYVKEGIIDLVIPLYFDEGLIQFDKFLLQIAEIIGLKADSFEINTTIEQRKSIIRDVLMAKKHPLVYLDNFETVSLILNESTSTNTRESIENANQITDFLNNIIPTNNTSILVTSREQKNNLSNEQVHDLEGLNLNDSIKLFNAFVRPIFKDLKGNARDQIDEILKKTGGHPLSIEIIAKNIRSIHELEKLSQGLGSLEEDSTQADKRFKTLRACFGYTIDKLNDKLQDLLPKLLLFSSPFPIFAAVEIFDVTENEILDLYDRIHHIVHINHLDTT